MNISELMIKEAATFGIDISSALAEKFSQYAELLIEWNEKINLTAITEPGEIVIKHFIDSLTLLPYLPEKDFSLIDVGTGAGFPGIPIKIMRKNSNILLLDSLNKRVNFLNEVAAALEIDIKTVHGRAEELGHDRLYREQFDFATARAVTNLPALLEYTLPFLSVGGRLIAMKGKDTEEEIENSQNALILLGGRIESKNRLLLPDGSERMIIVVEKISQISAKYPRRATKINKNPL